MLKYSHPFVFAALLAAGCASARPQPPAVAPGPAADPGAAEAGEPAGSLGSYVQAVREVSRLARPARPAALTVERWSSELGAAIERHSAAPTAENKVLLAQVYWRLGILDDAYENYNAAIRLDARQGAAWDGMARIWRDWGLPGYAIGHAYRAVSASPASAVPQNTLGTILLALGKGAEARQRFGMALALDPGAAYARNNLCYSWLMAGEPGRAEPECRNALALDPAMQPARNNLALARAEAGDFVGAAAVFGAVSGEAAAQYNLGIVFLSQRRYAAAATAFDKAAALQPALTLASVRARQARKHLAEDRGKEDTGERR